jgi:flagellar biosynthesis protein FlhG
LPIPRRRPGRSGADELSQTAIDWLFLAAPADAQPSLAYAAPLRILVVQGSKNHLTEAYALLKSVHRQQPEGRWWILFSHLAEPERATLMMQAITETSRRFLEVEPGYLGVVAQDGKLELSARAMRPVLDFAPASGAASAFRNAAQTLAQTIQPDHRQRHPRLLAAHGPDQPQPGATFHQPSGRLQAWPTLPIKTS